MPLTPDFNAKRPHQREIIEAALNGYDVYVQAATSFGKSLCFQLPAVIDPGSESYSRVLLATTMCRSLFPDNPLPLVTIVVSPLLSLMVADPSLAAPHF